MISLSVHLCGTCSINTSTFRCNPSWKSNSKMYFLNLFKKGEKLYVHFGVSSPLSWLWLFSECQFVKMIMWWHETVFNHKIWFKTIYSDELSSKTDLGVFFSTPKAIGRWYCVTGHKSDIPAEVMSVLCIMCCRCTLWRHMDTWSQLFQATHPSVTQKIYYGCSDAREHVLTLYIIQQINVTYVCHKQQKHM